MEKKKSEVGINDYESALSDTSQQYYDQARQQEYDALLDTEVQLENAKQNAQKYTQQQLANQGMASSGYGSTQQAGIYNDYINRVNAAEGVTSANINNINLQQATAEEQAANDRFESVTTMITQGTDLDNINNMMVNYGYGTIDENGDFVFGTKPEGMSDDDWYQTQYYYNMQKSALAENTGYNGAYYTSIDDWKNSSIPIEGGKTDTIKNKFNKESDILFSHISSGDVPYNSVVKMTNGNGSVMYVMNTSNGVRVATEAEYLNAKDGYAYEIVRNSKDNYSWVNRGESPKTSSSTKSSNSTSSSSSYSNEEGWKPEGAPDNPSEGQKYTYSKATWVYRNGKWVLI